MPESKAKKAWMRANTTVITVKFTHSTEQRYLDFLKGKKAATTIKKALDLLMEQEERNGKEEH